MKLTPEQRAAKYNPVGDPLAGMERILILRPNVELWIDKTLPTPRYFILIGWVSRYISDEQAKKVMERFRK